MGIWFILRSKPADKNLSWREGLGSLQKPITVIDTVAGFCLFHMDEEDR